MLFFSFFINNKLKLVNKYSILFIIKFNKEKKGKLNNNNYI